MSPMAKRRKSSTQIVRAYPMPPQSAPIIRVQTSSPRASGTRRRRSTRRRSSGGGGGHTGLRRLFNVAIGGAILGFVEKSFPKLPTLPLIGRAGTIALAAHYFGKGHPIMQDAALAGAAVAGYELGTTGKVSGDDDIHGTLAPQVSGVAAQV